MKPKNRQLERTGVFSFSELQPITGHITGRLLKSIVFLALLFINAPYQAIYGQNENPFVLSGENGNAIYGAYAYGTPHTGKVSGGIFAGHYARGTRATPAAVQSEDALASIVGTGYTGMGYEIGASIRLVTSQDWTPLGGHGTHITFSTTENNTKDRYEKMRISHNGNVGIGTTNPGAWKLAVKGKIRAEEIKVETGWADFVFYDDYKLPTLEEVERHIEEKGHLKDIPSAKEVEENGIFLGEMDSKLLQKIEELTLYLIDQNKQIARQKEQIATLARQVNKLQKQ